MLTKYKLNIKTDLYSDALINGFVQDSDHRNVPGSLIVHYSDHHSNIRQKDWYLNGSIIRRAW